MTLMSVVVCVLIETRGSGLPAGCLVVLWRYSDISGIVGMKFEFVSDECVYALLSACFDMNTHVILQD